MHDIIKLKLTAEQTRIYCRSVVSAEFSNFAEHIRDRKRMRLFSNPTIPELFERMINATLYEHLFVKSNPVLESITPGFNKAIHSNYVHVLLFASINTLNQKLDIFINFDFLINYLKIVKTTCA